MDDSKRQYLENALEDLLKAIKTLAASEEQLIKAQPIVASIKQPKMKMPEVPGVPKIPKLPGIPNASKKDPVKVAQQIKEKGKKKLEVGKAKINKKAFAASKFKTPKPGSPVVATSASVTPHLMKSKGESMPADEATVKGIKRATPSPIPSKPLKVSVVPQEQLRPIADKHRLNLQDKGMVSGPEDKTPVTAASLNASSPNSIVDADKHTLHPRFNSNSQKKLINGLDLNQGSEGTEHPGAMGARVLTHPDGHKLIVKNSNFGGDINRIAHGHDEQNFSSAKREVVYHNLAQDLFGLGKYVPPTAAFKIGDTEMSAQKKMDASHVFPHLAPHPEQGVKHQLVSDHLHGTLSDMNKKGDLHKLALMNSIMANNDRHHGNYMIDNKKKQLHLIDNGSAFDYVNKDPHHFPSYLKAAHSIGIQQDTPLHPEAAKMLHGLDTAKAEQLMKEHGFAPNHPATKGMVGKIRELQKLHHDNPNTPIEELLLRSREATHQPLDLTQKLHEAFINRQNRLQDNQK